MGAPCRLAANDANAETFNGQVLMFEIDLDRGEFGIFRQQPDVLAVTLEALDGDFLIETGDYDLAVADFLGGMHGQQIAIENADVLHAHAAYAQQVVGARFEEAGIELEGVFDMRLSEDWRPRRD